MQNSLPRLFLPTAWLPSVEYFALLASGAPVEIEVHETYQKQTCRNRCYIATANKVMPLSVPVVKTDGNNTRTGRMAVAWSEPWQRNHWRTIESAYRNAAWFIHYESKLKEVFFQRYDSLVEMNTNLVVKLARLMKLDVTIGFTPSWQAFYDDGYDMRQAFKGLTPLPCNSAASFKPYFQCFADRYGFQPNLSILDLLFNCGPDAVDYLLAHSADLWCKIQSQTGERRGFL